MTKVQAYGFFSAKGGSGKTALATAAAFAFANQGEQVAVFDVDFTGTSIADGLGLQAPGPGGALLGVDQTRAARCDTTVELPFLDAAMVPNAPTFDPIAMAWRHPEAPQSEPSGPSVQGKADLNQRRNAGPDPSHAKGLCRAAPREGPGAKAARRCKRAASGAERANVVDVGAAQRGNVVRQRSCAHARSKSKWCCRCYCRWRRAGCPLTSRAR